MRKVSVAWAVTLFGALGSLGATPFEVHPDRQGPSYEVPFYTGSIFPTPKEAQYFDELVPLSRVGVVLGEGIAKDDPRLTFLFERILRFGGDFEILRTASGEFDSFIMVGDTSDTETLCPRNAPQQPEGYLLFPSEKDGVPVIVLKGSDSLGILWAITAFNQLVGKQNGRAVVRKAMVFDYPDAPGRRAYTAMGESDTPERAWFAVNVLRANVVIYRMMRHPEGRAGIGWRELDRIMQMKNWRARIQKIGALLNPLGIEWYDSMLPITGNPKTTIRSKSEDDFQTVLTVATLLAEAGGNLCLLYDDARFPLSQEDQEHFGSAREADVYFLNKVYATVRAKYPNFKMLFCPPFYWGPLSDASAAYGEPRDEYLAAIGKRLPKAIDIYWTGPRVKSNRVTPEHLNWITGLIQRKPAYWQNTCGAYHGDLFYVYPTDALAAWKEWYCDGFFDQLAFHTYNGDDAYTSMTLCDVMWNRNAYDPADSSVEAGKKLVGTDAYPKLVEVCEALETLDTYGWFTPTARAARNVETVRKATQELDRIFETAPAPLKSPWLPLSTYVGYRNRYLERLLDNPQLKELTEVDDLVRKLAAKETGITPKQAKLILTPNDFSAGRLPRHYAWKGTERRYVLWINGAKSKAPSMSATFQLPYPLTGDSELVIAGLNHNAEPPCRIRILVNGNTVFEDANPFAQDRWTTHTFRVRGAFLRDGVVNTLEIVNIEDSNVMTGPPWFMINYVVLRPAK